MKRHKLVGPNDPILTTISQRLTVGAKVEYANSMERILRMSGNGIGIAANQIGIADRLFLMHDFNEGAYRIITNPEVISASKDTELGREGCLSFPGIFVEIERPVSVVFRYNAVLNFIVTDTIVTHVCDGIEARCFFHELDHINGICCVKTQSDSRASI